MQIYLFVMYIKNLYYRHFVVRT